LNVKVIVVLCPKPIANGRDGPEMLKPDPVTVSWVMVTLPPLTVTVSVLVEADPTVVLPKSRALELVVS